jgi:hypothetical protein
MNVKASRIEWFEGATDRLVSAKNIVRGGYVLMVRHVVADYDEPRSSQLERYNIQLSPDAQMLHLYASDWSGKFHRCSDMVNKNAPNK